MREDGEVAACEIVQDFFLLGALAGLEFVEQRMEEAVALRVDRMQLDGDVLGDHADAQRFIVDAAIGDAVEQGIGFVEEPVEIRGLAPVLGHDENALPQNHVDAVVADRDRLKMIAVIEGLLRLNDPGVQAAAPCPFLEDLPGGALLHDVDCSKEMRREI